MHRTLQSLAAGLRKDFDAVRAGLTEKWSNGCVEGFVHKLKLVETARLRKGGFRAAQGEDAGRLKTDAERLGEGTPRFIKKSTEPGHYGEVSYDGRGPEGSQEVAL